MPLEPQTLSLFFSHTHPISSGLVESDQHKQWYHANAFLSS